MNCKIDPNGVQCAQRENDKDASDVNQSQWLWLWLVVGVFGLVFAVILALMLKRKK